MDFLGQIPETEVNQIFDHVFYFLQASGVMPYVKVMIAISFATAFLRRIFGERD